MTSLILLRKPTVVGALAIPKVPGAKKRDVTAAVVREEPPALLDGPDKVIKSQIFTPPSGAVFLCPNVLRHGSIIQFSL